MLLAVLTASSAALAEQPAERVVVGVVLEAADPHVGTALAAEMHRLFARGGVDAVENCGEEATFCITMTAVPVRLGKRQGGFAVSSYVTRRLTAHPDWPWPATAAEPQSKGVVIEDAFTAAGNVSCVPCERRLETLEEKVGKARFVAGPSMVDEGDLVLQVGPAEDAFLWEVAARVVGGLLERHLRPWEEQLAKR